MDHTIDHASTIPAPSSTKITPRPRNAIHWYIGVQAGGAAAVLLEALEERRDRGVTPATRDQAGVIIGELCRIRYYMPQDFEALAKEHGVAMLHECGDVSRATAEWAVGQILAIVRKVMRARAS